LPVSKPVRRQEERRRKPKKLRKLGDNNPKLKLVRLFLHAFHEGLSKTEIVERKPAGSGERGRTR
jgi:hypothetical protein